MKATATANVLVLINMVRLGVILLCALAATAAIPYGSVTPFGALKLQVMAFATAAVAAFARDRFLGPAKWPLLLIACIGVVGLAQLVPLSQPTVESLSPSAASIYAETNRILTLFGESPVRPRLSIAPGETLRATLLIFAYCACFYAAAKLLGERAHRRAAIITILAASVIQVIYAAVTQTAEDRMHGFFVNPNHLAGYLEIALMLAFAVIWTEIVTGGQRIAPNQERAASIERRIVPFVLPVLAWVTIAVGIAMSKSRMGITAAAVTTLLLFATSAARMRRGKALYATIGAAIIAAGIALVGFITREIPLVRFLASDPRDPESDVRFRLWDLSVDAWHHFPLLGSGLGTYRDAFKRVQPADFPGLYEQAHNDALQLLVTGGWISLALAVAGLIAIGALLLRGWWKERHREERALALAAAAALFSLALHGIAEFNFSMPGIPATLAIVLGAGWAAIHHPNG